MTNATLKTHFTDLLAAENLTFPNVAQHVDRAVKIGLEDFWGAYDWSFRSADVELAITTTAESYDLADEFAGFRSVREKTSTQGADLIYKTKEDFDMLLPRPDVHAAGTPKWFTVFRDQENDKWKISFHPRPSAAMTIYIDQVLIAPRKVDAIPGDFVSGLMAFIAKHIYPYGHIGRLNAGKEAIVELVRLRQIDKVDKSHITVMFDDTREQSTFRYSWT